MTAPQAPVSLSHRRTGHADLTNLIAITVGWIVMIALVNPVAEFPLNDDWIYAGAAKSIIERGYFWIPGPAIPNVFAQAYWGALFSLPFGPTISTTPRIWRSRAGSLHTRCTR